MKAITGRKHGRPAQRRKDWPESLVKALSDPFSYALALKNGQVFEFTQAIDGGNGWVFLSHGGTIDDDMTCLSGVMSKFNDHVFAFRRGVDVRVSDISWCADSPHGS